MKEVNGLLAVGRLLSVLVKVVGVLVQPEG